MFVCTCMHIIVRAWYLNGNIQTAQNCSAIKECISKYNAYYLANMIIKNATYKSKQQVHICWVFLAFKHQPNQQANG